MRGWRYNGTAIFGVKNLDMSSFLCYTLYQKPDLGKLLFSMEENRTDNERDDEIVPFIGIPRKWANPTVKVYALIFLPYGTWVGYHQLVENTTKPLMERLAGFYTHLAGFSVFEVILFVCLFQLGDMLMYLTNRLKMKAARIRAEAAEQGRTEGLEQGKAEGLEQGRTEGLEQGIEQGIAEALRQCQEWNARRMEAEAKGEPFDEPFPTPSEISKNGKPTSE